MIMMAEGGEQKLNTNINAMLEQVGISVNNDSVIRKIFHWIWYGIIAKIDESC